MVAVFQFDTAILFGRLLDARFLLPYTVIAIIPAISGIIGGKYLGEIANTCLVIEVSYVGTVLLAFYASGELHPVFFLQHIFVSVGSVIPPLVFILAAILAYNWRQRGAAPSASIG